MDKIQLSFIFYKGNWFCLPFLEIQFSYTKSKKKSKYKREEDENDCYKWKLTVLKPKVIS